MKERIPRIGMDRFVAAEWMRAGAATARGDMSRDELVARLAADISAPAVRQKTAGILNRIWCPAVGSLRADIVRSASRSIADEPRSEGPMFLATAIAAYPYFRQVVENVGRLARIQGSCSAGEVHRRMFEKHGKRTTIDQATSYAVKTLVDWRLVKRMPDMRIAPAEPIMIEPSARAILAQAADVSRDSVSGLAQGDPLAFAFATSTSKF